MPEASVSTVLLPINVGPLDGLGSFCLHTAQPLKEFSNLYREGCIPEVEWDLRYVQPRRMSMAGLTAFLATAHRLRKFTKQAQLVRVRWDPQVFSFWEDISLFRIAREQDLLRWPEAIVGGFAPGQTNPDTELLMFPYFDVPNEKERRKIWKDRIREKFKDDLLLRCGRLFQSNRNKRNFPQKLGDEIAVTCAELVVNSLLWGHSDAFVGLQRSTRGITIAVCDSGRGFLASIYEKSSKRHATDPADHAEALVLGSLITTREFGLRRVINMITETGGQIVMSSFDAEIHWKSTLWQRAKIAAKMMDDSSFNIKKIMQNLDSPIRGKATLNDLDSGFFRTWQHGLRGVRITFEIPLQVQNERY